MADRIRYRGEGRYFDGVPARDLTEDEWYALPGEIRKTLIEQGLYQLERAKPAVKKAEEELKND